MKLQFLSKTLCCFLIILSVTDIKAQISGKASDGMVKLENPVTVNYIKTRLRKTIPRLILTPSIEAGLRKKIKTDPVVRNYYEAMKMNAEEILSRPLLTRKLTGRRLLSVSREMLYRMNILSMVYRMDKSPVILERINKEIKAVCNFTDWNPSHFLDVAEMSLGVSLAVDWAGSALPKATVELAKNSLIEKGIKPGFQGNTPQWWISSENNWNQVCNGGMIAAAITVADKDPELAAKTISRSLEGIPYALKQYMPLTEYILRGRCTGNTEPASRWLLHPCLKAPLERISV